MKRIALRHMEFLEEAKGQFKAFEGLQTYRDTERRFIALRDGTNRNDIHIFELGPEVGYFEDQLENSALVVRKKEAE